MVRQRAKADREAEDVSTIGQNGGVGRVYGAIVCTYFTTLSFT